MDLIRRLKENLHVVKATLNLQLEELSGCIVRLLLTKILSIMNNIKVYVKNVASRVVF